MKKLLIILFFITFTNNAYSDLKFDKDLKKVSKHNAFFDSEGKGYAHDLPYTKCFAEKDNNIIPYLEKIF